MKEKSQIEKNAQEKQVYLLSSALDEAANIGGHWLNVPGKVYPNFYPKRAVHGPALGQERVQDQPVYSL